MAYSLAHRFQQSLDLASSSSSSSDSSEGEEEFWNGDQMSKVNLSYMELDTDTLEVNITSMVTVADPAPYVQVTSLRATNNQISLIPSVISCLSNLTRLDLSNNSINQVCDSITNLSGLTHLFLRNNHLNDDSLPKDMIGMRSLKTLNLSGNRLTAVPPQLLDISSLRNLFLGANSITHVDTGIKRLRRLKLLYLGGNLLETVPEELGDMPFMQVLLLSDNKIRRLPEAICRLNRLECLHLHRNRLTTLPSGLIHLKSLAELSLRENPLVMRFIRDMEYQPTSLLELAGRVIRQNNVQYDPMDLPRSLQTYLSEAQECVNPNCRGVYFDHRVEHVKFSDFCGKYKVPLLQYLCSPRCRDQLPEYADCDLEDSQGEEDLRLKRVLLG